MTRTCQEQYIAHCFLNKFVVDVKRHGKTWEIGGSKFDIKQSIRYYQ